MLTSGWTDRKWPSRRSRAPAPLRPLFRFRALSCGFDHSFPALIYFVTSFIKAVWWCWFADVVGIVLAHKKSIWNETARGVLTTFFFIIWNLCKSPETWFLN
jgi:hypothetical protein